MATETREQPSNSETSIRSVDVEPAVMPTAHQGAAVGALRIALLAMDEAQRHIESHYLNDLILNRTDYIEKQAELNNMRLAAAEALKPMWKIVEV